MIPSIPVFIGLTLVLFGGCAFMTGQALASTWRPWWQALPYGVMLGTVDRFLGYALFNGDLLSWPGAALDSGVLVAIALTAYRRTLARRMVDQYPWLYAPVGLFAWREMGKE